MPSIKYFYKEYSCSYNLPLSCDRPLETAQQIKGAKFCLECGFPATLPIEVEIKGNRGSYVVTKFLGVRGLGRLYAGVQQKDQQPVIIKEYLLPVRCFNEDEALKRKETFKRVGGVNLADGRLQNFRVIQTWEAIADEKGERCYLITKDTEPSQTLSQYLIAKGAMTAPQVREFLNQALQTLIFLQTQKLRLPSNQVQKGLEHGNISLDSLLIKLENNEQFYIYFCDLANWENLFIPPDIVQASAKTYKGDLESLGLVAFYLWLGRTTNSNTGETIRPEEHSLLPNTDDYLKQFIYRLIGFDNPFEDATIARQELLQLPQHKQVNETQKSLNPEPLQLHFYKNRFLLGLLALILLIGGILYYFWQQDNRLEISKYFRWNSLDKDFSEVNNVPPGTFKYSGEKNGTWSFILKQAPETESKLEELLTKPRPDVQATFKFDDNSNSNLIEEVRSGHKAFVITSLKNNTNNIDMNQKNIAYDGLLVFVAFNKNKNSLLQALEGKISIQQLHEIYTGKVKNWHEIAPKKISNLPIQAYVPQEIEAREKFKQLVLKENEQDINLFEENIAKFQTENTGNTQKRMREAIQKGQETGIISFGILSKTWNQCSGYPLAIVDRENKQIQPLFRQLKQRPIKPSDDLCDKANYFDVETFHSDKNANYPLGYPIYIVYPKDNSFEPAGSVFANILRTRKGQCLLNKVGLVPLQPIPIATKNNNAC
ncbi:substrate-binding domain-containing protein [Nostoc linckia FACHB-104]|nr:substrate-binding domain-containing protein [Nostoc linckia FACHB-104]